jgi:hypothetical protein
VHKGEIDTGEMTVNNLATFCQECGAFSLFLIDCYSTCCGSKMIITDPDFYASRIADPDLQYWLVVIIVSVSMFWFGPWIRIQEGQMALKN